MNCDLNIMRLTRYRLCHGRVACLFILWVFFASVPIISVIAQKSSSFPKTKNTQMNCLHLNISCICHHLFARLRENLICLLGWFSIELTTTNLVLNALVDYKFSSLFFSCFLIFHNSLKMQRKKFFLICDLRGSNQRP